MGDSVEKIGASNRSELVDYILNNLDNLTGGLSDFEKTMVRDIMGVTQREVPTTKLQLTERIADALKCKSNLNYLLLALRRKKFKTKNTHDDSYYEKFYMLTKMGRPSKAAIDSEIYHLDSNLKGMNREMDEYEIFFSFLEEHSNLLNRYIQNLEARRYDVAQS